MCVCVCGWTTLNQNNMNSHSKTTEFRWLQTEKFEVRFLSTTPQNIMSILTITFIKMYKFFILFLGGLLLGQSVILCNASN